MVSFSNSRPFGPRSTGDAPRRRLRLVSFAAAVAECLARLCGPVEGLSEGAEHVEGECHFAGIAEQVAISGGFRGRHHGPVSGNKARGGLLRVVLLAPHKNGWISCGLRIAKGEALREEAGQSEAEALGVFARSGPGVAAGVAVGVVRLRGPGPGHVLGQSEPGAGVAATSG